MKFFLYIFLLSVSLFFNPLASAQFGDEAVTKYILVGDNPVKIQNGIDLSNKDLRGIRIHTGLKELKNINFSGANLENANFADTIFVDCDFSNANLTKCYFYLHRNCNFSDAHFDRTGIQFGPESLKKLANYNSPERDLNHFLFCVSNYSKFDFAKCNLKNATFSSVRLTDADFTDSVIEGAIFRLVVPGFLDFSEQLPANMMRIYHNAHGDFDFKIEQLLVTKDFKEGFVKKVSFNRLVWPYHVVDLSNMVFVDCHFGWSDESAKIDLTDSVISGCNFEYFHGLTLENVKSTWNYKHNRMEGIKLPDEIQKTLDTEKTDKKP